MLPSLLTIIGICSEFKCELLTTTMTSALMIEYKILTVVQVFIYSLTASSALLPSIASQEFCYLSTKFYIRWIKFREMLDNIWSIFSLVLIFIKQKRILAGKFWRRAEKKVSASPATGGTTKRFWSFNPRNFRELHPISPKPFANLQV